MNNIFAVTKYETLKIIRQPIVIFFGMVFPVAWTVMNAMMWGDAPNPKFDGKGTIEFMIPAFMFLIILVNGLSNIPLVLSKNIESNVIRRYALTPLTKIQYIFGILLSNVLMVSFSSLVMIIVAKVGYRISIPDISNMLLIFFIVIILSIGVASFGITLACICKGFQTTMAVSLLTYFLLLFITGASVPLPVLPDSMQKFSQYIPFTQMVNLLQDCWFSNIGDVVIPLVVSVCTVVVSIILGFITFRWDNE